MSQSKITAAGVEWWSFEGMLANSFSHHVKKEDGLYLLSVRRKDESAEWNGWDVAFLPNGYKEGKFYVRRDGSGDCLEACAEAALAVNFKKLIVGGIDLFEDRESSYRALINGVDELSISLNKRDDRFYWSRDYEKARMLTAHMNTIGSTFSGTSDSLEDAVEAALGAPDVLCAAAMAFVDSGSQEQQDRYARGFKDGQQAIRKQIALSASFFNELITSATPIDFEKLRSMYSKSQNSEARS